MEAQLRKRNKEWARSSLVCMGYSKRQTCLKSKASPHDLRITNSAAIPESY